MSLFFTAYHRPALPGIFKGLASLLAALGLFWPGVPAFADAGKTLPGPLPAQVLRVIDGDTVSVRVQVWLGQHVETTVRLTGIDAPELRGKCAREQELAKAAQAALGDLLRENAVELYDIRAGKYGGRVLATARTSDGADIATALIARGLARRYDGGRRISWCL